MDVQIGERVQDVAEAHRDSLGLQAHQEHHGEDRHNLGCEHGHGWKYVIE